MGNIYYVKTVIGHPVDAFNEKLNKAIDDAQRDSLDVEIQYQGLSKVYYSALLIARTKN